jgi:AcrR family transcriptional regulator
VSSRFKENPRQPSDIEAVPAVERIRRAALTILKNDGPQMMTTRAVCDAAGVTAPTLYHHYGHKDGLLLALAGSELQAFFAAKGGSEPTKDLKQDVQRGWDEWIEFAIDQPHLVRAIQSGGSPVMVPFREMAEAIVERRLTRLQSMHPLVVPPQTGARLLVAGANTVVQLLLDGLQMEQVHQLSKLLRDRLIDSLIELPNRKA